MTEKLQEIKQISAGLQNSFSLHFNSSENTAAFDEADDHSINQLVSRQKMNQNPLKLF